MIIDCSHQLSEGLPGYPGDEPFLHITTSRDGDVTTSSFETNVHFGTHMDTPRHFVPNGPALNSWTPEMCVTRALWLFCEESARGFTLAPSIDLGSQPAVDWIFLCTGWSERWSTESYYEDFPGLDQTLVEDLLDLPLTGIGLDAASIDPVPGDDRTNHYRWLSANRYILENLRRDPSVQDGTPYETIITPLPIPSLEGSPCRVLHAND